MQLKEGIDKRAQSRWRPYPVASDPMTTAARHRPDPAADATGAGRRADSDRSVVVRHVIGTLFTRSYAGGYVGGHNHKAGSERTKEIADFDLGKSALKPS